MEAQLPVVEAQLALVEIPLPAVEDASILDLNGEPNIVIFSNSKFDFIIYNTDIYTLIYAMK